MNLKKLTAFLLVLCLAAGIFPYIETAAAEELYMSDYDVVRKMDELFDMFEGKYFTVTLGPACGVKRRNHSCANCLTNNIVTSDWFVSSFGEGITVDLFPRTYTADGYFGGAAYSCAGFATFAEWYIFRQSRTAKVETVRIGRYMYTAENVREKVMKGDLIRMKNAGHSFIVYDYDDTGVTVLDCNWGAEYNCLVQKHVIKFSQYGGDSITISRVPHKTDYALSVTYDANGGGIDSEIIGDRYSVASSTGLNMRTGPGLDYPIVKLFPYGTVFDTFYTDEPVKADGYTWVRSVIEGNDGWLAVSKTSLAGFVCRIRSSDYYVGEDGTIYKAEDGERLRHILEYGAEYDNGLPEASSLGIYYDGHVFRGWSSDENASAPIIPGDKLSAEDLLEPGETGVTDIRLYAVWASWFGDCNGDGEIDGKDLIRLRKYLSSLDGGEADVSVCPGTDCNGDGVIDGRDLIRLRKYFASYDDEAGSSEVNLGP